MLLLPALVLLTLLLFGGDRGHFYRRGHHDWVSSEQLALAANLAPEHRFLMFYYRSPAGGDEVFFELYNRWPVSGYVPLRLAILPFAGDLSAQIVAGRLLQLLFFAGSVTLAYLALRRLEASRWVALTATLMVFSSYYSLYYSDMISPEMGLNVFGVLLTFHGMLVFLQEGRFRQLLLKACAALLLGWHAYTLLLPFILFGLTRELVRARQAGATLPRLARTLLRSRHLTLGVVTLLFGASLLAFNLNNERLALKGEVPLTELPTVVSFLVRTGIDPNFDVLFARRLDWRPFLEGVFYRLGGLTLPYTLADTFVDLARHPERPVGPGGALLVILGIVAGARCLTRAWRTPSPYGALMASFALSGFLWLLAFRNATVLHDYWTLHVIGVPLLFHAAWLSWLRRRHGERLVAGLALLAALLFVLSGAQLSRIGQDATATALDAALVADFEQVRAATAADSRIFVPAPNTVAHMNPFAGARHAVNFYLAGRLIGYGRPRKSDGAGFELLLTPVRLAGARSLTPDNRLRFLYRVEDYAAAFQERLRALEGREPVLRADFTVWLEAGRLIYLRQPCSLDDIMPRFTLQFTPAAVSDLPAPRRQYGFDNRDFVFSRYGLRFDDQCLAEVPLPDYEVVAIRTGQFITEQGGYRMLWSGEFPPEPRPGA